jgi:hypothetical protein
MRSNTTPPVPTANLTAAAASALPLRRSEDCQRPAPLRQHEYQCKCKWRFHSAATPCLCENDAWPTVVPVDILNLPRLPGANTPWLGSPSWTNFG